MPGNRALRRAVAPNVFEAFRELVYAFGPERLAAITGQRIGTIYNKADADDESHNQPTLRDVVIATHASGDMRVLDALEEMFGRVGYDCAQHESESDEALLELLTKLGAENGEFHQALNEALRGKQFTAAALRKVRGEAFDVVSALMVLVKRLEAYVDDEA